MREEREERREEKREKYEWLLLTLCGASLNERKRAEVNAVPETISVQRIVFVMGCLFAQSKTRSEATVSPSNAPAPSIERAAPIFNKYKQN